MGNTLSHQPPSLTRRLNDRYLITSSDPQRGIRFLQDHDNNHFVLKQLSAHDHSQIQLFRRLCETKTKDRNPYILKLHEAIFATEDSYCSMVYKTYLVFQKPFKDLRTEMKERKGKGGDFDEDELMSVIQTGTLGLKYLKSINQPHPSVNSSSILLSREGIILLSDPWLNLQASSSHLQHSYPSPESLELVQLSRTDNLDWLSSALFSLGMVVLEMYHLEFMDDIYGANRELNTQLLNKRIDSIRHVSVRKYVEQLLGTKRRRLLTLPQMESYAETIKTSETELKNETNPNQILQQPCNTIFNFRTEEKSEVTTKSEANQRSFNATFVSPEKYKIPHYLAHPATSYEQGHTVSTEIFRKQYTSRALQQSLNVTNLQGCNVSVAKPNRRVDSSIQSKQKPKLFSCENHQPNSSLVLSRTTRNHFASSQNSPSITSMSLLNYSTQTPTPTQSYSVLKSISLQHNTPGGLAFSISPHKQLNQSMSQQDQMYAKNNSQILSGHLPTQISHASGLSYIDSALLKSEHSSSSAANRTLLSNPVSDVLECSYKSPIAMVNSSSIDEGKLLSHSENVSNSIDKSSEEYLLRCESSEVRMEVRPLEKNEEVKIEEVAESENEVEEVEGDNVMQTAPKKSRTLRQFNSTIMEVSDSENKSDGYRELEEDAIEVSKKSLSSKKITIDYNPDGTRYEGRKKNGVKHGFGKYIYEDGAYVEGLWKNDQLNGHGKLYYSNGQLAYDGEYENGEFNGSGKVYNLQPLAVEGDIDYQDLNSVTEEWEWYQGWIRREQKHGPGKIMYSNGEVFEGEFKFDKMNGKGKFRRGNGEVIEGVWIDGRLLEQF